MNLVKLKNMSKTSIIVLVVAVIALAGVVVWQGLVQPKPSSALPETNQPAVNQEQQNQDETAGWKTYRNEEYGFEIKYPPDWQFVEYPAINSVGFGKNPVPEGSSGENDFGIIVYKDPISIPDIINQSMKKYLVDTSQSNGIIDGEKSFIIEGRLTGLSDGPAEKLEGNTIIGVFSTKKGTTYRFNGSLGNPFDSNKKMIFDKVLSTFKFLK